MPEGTGAATTGADRGLDVPLVRLSGITKRFPGVLANDEVSFDIRPGEVHALLGENGAGKSTLIAILSGVLQPDSGRIEVNGRPVRIASPRDAIRLGIGTVYQHSTLVPTLSVVQNLMLGQRWWRPLGRAAALARLAELSALLGVRVDPDATAGSLSLGQQQQVEIVKALWRGERVLVLDEPTSMLTPQGVEELGQVMARLAARGFGIVFVSHKLQEVLAFGHRVTVLKLGRKAGEIPPARLSALSPAEATAEILDLMFGRGAADPEAPRRRASTIRADDAPLLEVEHLSAGEGAVQDVSFALRPGEILGIAGVDGNGQKQLAEALAGQLRAEAGRIRFAGRDITRLPVARRHALGLRYLTDDRLGEGTVGGFAIGTNLVMKRVGEPPFWTGGFERPARIAAHARELIGRYDVRTPGPEVPIATLSGGNIQKALFGRELSGEPRLLLANKPTYGLDVANIRAARDRISAAAAAGVACILISTELDELLELSDRIAVMYRGRIAGIVGNGPDAERAIGRLMVGGA
ncbi:MAG: ABC transporter ATP-binding protein [Acetobacteraceae bacterium]|nr:ABC transporter ATP-binding protein [Acetobacteraceae bacterium]